MGDTGMGKAGCWARVLGPLRGSSASGARFPGSDPRHPQDL